MLTKQLYRGKASTLYLGHCRHAMQTVVIKAYSKRRLSPLNWCGRGGPAGQRALQQGARGDRGQQHPS